MDPYRGHIVELSSWSSRESQGTKRDRVLHIDRSKITDTGPIEIVISDCCKHLAGSYTASSVIDGMNRYEMSDVY